jgi:2'-5' RNA ligase
MIIKSTFLENDEFGYSCYTIVLPAHPDMTEKLLEIESAAGQTIAKIPAHITVKGTLYGIPSLEGMIELIRTIAKRHQPFRLGVQDWELFDSEHSVILGFTVNTEIQALHDDLVANIAPLGKPAYYDDPYRVHMSIVNEVEPEGVVIARDQIAQVDFGAGLQLGTIDLMARDGMASGGVWKRLERFELGG